MTASPISNEHYVVLEHSESSELASARVASGTVQPRRTAGVSHPHEAMCSDSRGVGVSLGTIQEVSRAGDQPNPAVTRRNLDSHILQNYQRGEKNFHFLAGAKRFLAYLEGKQRSLAEVTKTDLEQWACTNIAWGKGQGHRPSPRSFQGAKGLCAFAAQVGYIDAQRAKNIAECPQPQIDVSVLRNTLQNPGLTRKDQENSIRIYFQSVEKNLEHHAGATAFQAYLASQARPLSEATTSDVERWALTPVSTRTGKLTVPSPVAFEGAKRLCALAGEVGYIDLQRAHELAECKRPHFTVDALRHVLQNPALTRKEREHHIFLTYESSENTTKRIAGATSFRAYLERAEIHLAKVTKSNLEEWALTPLKINGNIPDVGRFEGAKALCALAAQVGHIDAQRAEELATSTRPHFDVDLLRTALQNPALTRKERDYHIHLHYQSLEKDNSLQSGASGIMAYLKRQGRSLSDVTASDLKGWALTPSAKAQGNLPNPQTFEGAKALCALAAEVGHIDAQRAQELAQCPRPQTNVESLRLLLQSPQLTPKERDYRIRLNYQSTEKNAAHQSGASRFLAYLESQNRSLAEASSSDLEAWAHRPVATDKSNKTVPTMQAFEGAKALCALASEIGHLDAQRAQAIAACPRPRFDNECLRLELQNPTLTSKERENHIWLNYQSAEKNRHFRTGAKRFLAHLERAEIPLAEVTKNNLEEWALTPFVSPKGKRTLPSPRAFKGAQGLCAVAAEVGYINAQSAKEIAACPRPHFVVDFLRIMLENPVLSAHDSETQIRLHYQSTEKNLNRQAGANGFLAYLKNRASSLAAATKSDLEQWALTHIAVGQARGTLPSRQAFVGAKALCALAAQVGYIDAQRASEIAECTQLPAGVASTSRVTCLETGLQTAEHSSAMLERANKRRRTVNQGASTSMSHSFALPQSDALFRELALSPPSLLDLHPHVRSPQTGSTLSLIDELENLEDILGSSGHLY